MRFRQALRRYCGTLATVAALSVIAAAPAAAAGSVELVLGPADAPTALRVGSTGAEAMPMPGTAPLGSLWKLFVYAYLVDNELRPADYRCTGKNPSEESYCCAPGGSIGRDEALAKSCGLYFSPQRLGIREADWSRYWRRNAIAAPPWLVRLESMQPDNEVDVASLLAALSAIEGPARAKTMRALQKVSLEPRARPLLSRFGSRLRIKTWSWHDGKGRRVGGFAGWLADGRPLWMRGPGTSASVIEEATPWLAEQLPVASPAEEACVRVRFFTRYPLAAILQDGVPVEAGTLSGKVSVRFVNGSRMDFAGSPGMSLRQSGGQPLIEGRFGVNEYVARVLQREAAAEPPAAARALAVAARTYLVRHAGFAGGCYEIADDSRTQRVSPAPPGRAALAAAEWSDGLVLAGADGRYHQNRTAPRQLAWTTAVRQAHEGAAWDEILEQAYGGGFALLGDGDAGECQPLMAAERWLAGRLGPWKRNLAGQPGFETPQPLPRVCRLDHGNPYADIARNRIYATGVASANERLTLTHEFLHFALANHPLGRDEDFVERTARSLLSLP